MTTMLNARQPDTPENLLVHYGVLGMKWGKTRAKATTSQVHRARMNVRREKAALADKVSEVRATPKGSAERAQGKSDLAKMKADFYKNPDRVVAARLTRGEKTVIALLGFPEAIAVTSAVSRRIERKQELGKYDKG